MTGDYTLRVIEQTDALLARTLAGEQAERRAAELSSATTV